jgi:hypothetical protein
MQHRTHPRHSVAPTSLGWIQDRRLELPRLSIRPNLRTVLSKGPRPRHVVTADVSIAMATSALVVCRRRYCRCSLAACRSDVAPIWGDTPNGQQAMPADPYLRIGVNCLDRMSRNLSTNPAPLHRRTKRNGLDFLAIRVNFGGITRTPQPKSSAIGAFSCRQSPIGRVFQTAYVRVARPTKWDSILQRESLRSSPP